MAFQWWAQRGEPQRTGFICLENAYHGDTIGAVSVGGIDLFHSLYRPLLFDSWQARAGDAGHLEQLLDEHGGQVAAVIVEPLVQGAAGMLMQPDGYLRRVRELLRRPRRAADLRRGRDRVRPYRHDVRLRARGDRARPAVRRQGPHRRLPAARRDARPPSASTRASSARPSRPGRSSTATRTPATRSPAPPGSRRSRRSSASGRSSALQPKIELLSRLLEQRIAVLPGVAEVRQRGFMVGIELIEQPARGPDRPPGRARGPPARRDHPPARRRRRADAAAVDLRRGPAPAGRDHGHGDRRGDVRAGCTSRHSVDDSVRYVGRPW